MSRDTFIADRIVTTINDSDLGLTAARHYTYKNVLEEMGEDFVAGVIPFAIETGEEDRDGDFEEYTFTVFFAKRVRSPEASDVDDAHNKAEALHDLLRDLDEATDTDGLTFEQKEVRRGSGGGAYDAELLRQHNTYFSAVQMKFSTNV